MNTISHNRPARARLSARCRLLQILLLAWLCAIPVARAQITEVGEVARDFQVTDRFTGQPVYLYDYAGQVILLDFFAYWCGPCRTSSPDVEVNISRYYETQGGNAHGVPVAVLSVNIEDGDEAATDLFVQEAGLAQVANDYAGDAYFQFSTGFIPLFVLINGVAGSPSHQQWEVLHRDSGYPGALYFRNLIDSVEGSNPTAPPRIVEHPVGGAVRAGDPLQLAVRATGAQPLEYQWYHNDDPLDGATDSTWTVASAQLAHNGDYTVEVTNAYGSERSLPATVRVRLPGPITTFRPSQVGLAIPDDNASGVTSTLGVPDSMEILQLKLSLSITHTYIGDLRVVLTSPSGTIAVIHDHEGGSSDNININQLELPVFAGEDARGLWTLFVVDLAPADTGTLNSWLLEIERPALSLGELYVPWIESFVGLTSPEQEPTADPDADGLANIFEFLLADCAPDQPNSPLSLSPALSAPDYLELAIPWRSDIDPQACQILMTQDLSLNDWREVQPQGADVLVDRDDPTRTLIRFHRRLTQVFVRLAVDPSQLGAK